MMKRALIAGCVAMLALSVVPTAAGASQADPVDDAFSLVDEVLRCTVWVDEPLGNPVRGSGGGRCNVGDLPVTVVVCLDYNGVTVPTSCRTYQGTGGADGSSNPTTCLPGLWQTQVTMTHIIGSASSRTHSDPVLYTCLD